ncbi:hypothetical protein [Brevundimonas aveniformis]|uniref:hypothetical protein n=1 Tax=Brevundimonas aveniformis TaxID=370977 RepID=UPI000419888A|nr:hypothetical protein [Brevundimonas aveniformis]
MTLRTILILGAAASLAACSPAADDTTQAEAPAGTDTASAAPDAGSDAAMTPASLTPEQADQAFRCNALFTAVVAGRIGGQMEPLPADLDAQVRTSGAAFWNDREQAAIAALGLTPDQATARVAQAAEAVVGRRQLSEQDLTDLRSCVEAMG